MADSVHKELKDMLSVYGELKDVHGIYKELASISSSNIFDFKEQLTNAVNNIQDSIDTHKSIITEFIEGLKQQLDEVTNLCEKIDSWDKDYTVIEDMIEEQIVPLGDMYECEDLETLKNKNFSELLSAEEAPFYSVNKILEKINTLRNCENDTFSGIFQESIEAYNKELYSIALIGLMSTLDRIIFKMSKYNNPRMNKRTKIIEDKLCEYEESGGNITSQEFTYFSYTGFFRIMESIWSGSDFSKNEPDSINRHWVAHGMSNRHIIKSDCIKVLRLIYAAKILEGYIKDQ